MMSREEILAYAADTYGAQPEYPWEKHPTYGVLRHRHNRKWFAVVMEVPRCKLHLEGEGTVDVLNLKCEPLMIGPLRHEPGVLPAYHMNKEHWITILLDSPFPPETIRSLLDLSFDLTR